MTEKIIEPIDSALIEAELTRERLLRETNKGHNEIYVVDGRECVNTMREIGRLRELAFRAAGGGTGKAVTSTSSILWIRHVDSSLFGIRNQN